MHLWWFGRGCGVGGGGVGWGQERPIALTHLLDALLETSFLAHTGILPATLETFSLAHTYVLPAHTQNNEKTSCFEEAFSFFKHGQLLAR